MHIALWSFAYCPVVICILPCGHLRIVLESFGNAVFRTKTHKTLCSYSFPTIPTKDYKDLYNTNEIVAITCCGHLQKLMKIWATT